MGLAETSQKAKAIVMAGLVLANGEKITKAGTLVDEKASIRLLGRQCPYVSRGGFKLAHALDVFKIYVEGACCLDIGSSTGGFTDCLLQRQAKEVYCVDVGRGQLDWKLRTDPRVIVMERYNARYLNEADFPNACFSMISMDLSFISQRLILPPLYKLLMGRGEQHVDIVTLVKPQFEAVRSEVGKGGIVRDVVVHKKVVEDISSCADSTGFRVIGSIPSPIAGADGNVEFLLHLQADRTGYSSK